MADYNIAMGVKQPEPVNYLGQMAQIMGIKALQDEMQGSEGVRSAIQSGMSPTDPRMLMYGKRGEAVARAGAAINKEQLDSAVKRYELMGQVFGYVKNNPTLDNAIAAIDSLAQNGVLTPQAAAQAKAQAAADPSKIGEHATRLYTQALSAKDQLPKLEAKDFGGTVGVLSIDPVTGEAKQTYTQTKTISPDAAAQVGATMRGQDILDRRARYIHDNPHSTLQVVGDQVVGVQGVPGAMPKVTPMPAPGAANALVPQRQPAPSMVNNLLRDTSPTALTSVPPPVMSPQAFDTTKPAPTAPAAPAAWTIPAKPVWNEKTQSFITPPTAQNPAGSVTPMPAAQASAKKESARQALSAAGFNPETGADDLSPLIQKSTSGMFERAGAAAQEAVTGKATPGMEAIAQLAARANTITLDMVGGHLGAGFSNEDRTFILGKLGDVANPNIGANARLKAWQDAVSYMKNLAGYSSASATANAPAVGTVSKGYKYKGGDPSQPSSWEKQ